MIYLITGFPGDGKTLYTLCFVKALLERENTLAEKEGRPLRQVFYSGINELQLPWTEIQAEDWHKCPPGSIVLIDEAQRLLRPRSYGSAVPEYVSAFETHRHGGNDVFLITQHPMLLDVSVRRLTKMHFHCVRKFGFAASTVHEFVNGVRDDPTKNRDGSVRHDFRFPKESYGWYKSAEVHTHRVRIPVRVFLLLALPLVLGAMAWYLWRSMSARMQPPVPAPSATASGSPAGGGGATAGARPAAGFTAVEYVQAQVPRVSGLAYTAPAFDQVTQVTQAPYPAACVVIRGGCRCWSQQGTRLDVPDGLCRSIVSGGFFVAWDSEGRRVERRPVASTGQPVAVPVPQPAPGAGLVVINGGGVPAAASLGAVAAAGAR